MTRTLVALAIVVACFKSASDLAPFPCAADRTCPGGLACSAGSSGVAECVRAALDTTCTTGGDPTTCANAGSEAICSASLATSMPSGTQQVGSGSPIVPPIGACEQACPCADPSRTCAPDSVCLADCVVQSDCPANTRCLAAPTGMLCVPNGIACQSVAFNSGSARCSSTMCTREARGTSCDANGDTCPSDSACVSSSECTCNVGRVAFSCSDQLCNGACTGGMWWCAPDVNTFNCNSDLDGMTATCKCWDGTQRSVTCNVSGKSCEDLCAGR